jgi:hypothetical protein
MPQLALVATHCGETLIRVQYGFGQTMRTAKSYYFVRDAWPAFAVAKQAASIRHRV